MSEVYSLYLMEVLMQANDSISCEDAWHYFLMRFPHTWGSYVEFETFLRSQSALFEIHNNHLFLKSSQIPQPMSFVPHDFDRDFQVASLQVAPHPALQPTHDFAAEAEAVKYFYRQISRRSDKWVLIRSLAGHLSQASNLVRTVVGPQSDFIYFLLRHPRIFEIQGDLVSLRDELKTNHATRRPSRFQHNNARRNRPMSMIIPSSFCAVQETSVVSDDIKKNASDRQNLSSISQCPNGAKCRRQQDSQTIVISLDEYFAVLWSRQAIHKHSTASEDGISILTLMREFVSAPDNIRNIIGYTQIDVIEFLKKFDQLFETDESTCRNKVLDRASTTIVIADPISTNNETSLINKKGVAFCVSKSWGIIDLGQHEHVFFDRSLFKHVGDLSKHFLAGDTLCFNAILAPKESRAKWRATHVWKEGDALAAQLTNLVLSSDLSSTVSYSEGNSDSGVQDATVTKPNTTGARSPPELQHLLSNSEFNVIRIDTERASQLLIMQELEAAEASDDDDVLDPPPVVNGEHSDSSDLNTMSDIPSISSCLPDVGRQQARNPSAAAIFVSAGTQTYYTGDILAKKIYHEDAIRE